MSSSIECIAHVRDGHIVVGSEIAARLKARGATRVRLIITPSAAESDELAQRGIEDDLVERVANAQGFDIDVATVALLAEGSVQNDTLRRRLADLLPADR